MEVNQLEDLALDERLDHGHHLVHERGAVEHVDLLEPHGMRLLDELHVDAQGAQRGFGQVAQRIAGHVENGYLPIRQSLLVLRRKTAVGHHEEDLDGIRKVELPEKYISSMRK